jgi:hypothetical protein
MTAEIEVELFIIVLDTIGMTEIVNEVIEINLAEAGTEYEACAVRASKMSTSQMTMNRKRVTH